MSTVTLAPGGLVEKDTNEQRVIVFDWDDALGTNVTITTSTWTIAMVRPRNESPIALTQDNDSIVSGSRSTQVRLKVGTLGSEYKVTNQIVTNESPTQTKEQSVYVKVVDK